MNILWKACFISCVFAKFCLFIFHFFPLEEFSAVKKCALPKFLYVVWASIRSSLKKVSLFIHLKFSCCTNFFREGWWWSDWVGKGWSYFKKREKNGRNQSNTWQQHCAFWGRLMEQAWWKKSGLWLSPRFSVPRGNDVWLFFWDT